ncbi:MAG: CBS domain-containing protein [Vulcanimicrobiota bacterium]
MYSPHVHPNVYVAATPNPGPRSLEPGQPVRKARDQEPHEPPDECPKEKRRMTIASIMARQVMTVPPGLPIEQLGPLFTRHHVSGFPVVGAGGELLGLVSQADLVSRLPGDPRAFYRSLFLEPSDPPEVGCELVVADIMTPYVFYATEDSSLAEVLDLMLENGIHRVVVTKDGKLTGLVTTMDLLSHFRETL